MLNSLTKLKEYSISATDGVIGRISDLYFDNAEWTVRYVVVETGDRFSSRKVLILPNSIKSLDAEQRVLTVSVSRAEVLASPVIDTNRPVSRQHEIRLLAHYRYPRYWERGGLARLGSYPPAVSSNLSFRGTSPEHRQESIDLAYLGALDAYKRHTYDDAHLGSCSALLYRLVHATDGDIGRTQDVLIDGATWTIPHLVLNTGHWWKGHRVLLDPKFILASRGTERRLAVNRTRAFLKEAPPYPEASA
jgi:hypothetical protein